MQEMRNNNTKQWSSNQIRSASDTGVVLLSFDDDENHHEKRDQSDYCEVANTLKKRLSLQSFDETAEVSESDSDFGSEHSFSVNPYPSDAHVIPTKNNQEQPTTGCYPDHEPVPLRLVTPHSSRVKLDEQESLLDNVLVHVDNGKTKQPSARKRYLMVAICLVAAFFSYQWVRQNTCAVTSPRDTIYVPGAGFSGFWFTLGRLQSIEQPAANDYYCFSAGCLGVVASLRNFTVDETLDIALNIQHRWKTGQIERHDVVGEFVDTLVNTTFSDKSSLLSIEESSVLERMHVITSVKDKWFGMKTHIRSPQTSDELREMLLQTTWIPFAVGHSLWHTDSTGASHMDGAFTMPFHPKTTHTFGLPLSPEILLNVVNVNIGLEKVKQFWQAGMSYGV